MCENMHIVPPLSCRAAFRRFQMADFAPMAGSQLQLQMYEDYAAIMTRSKCFKRRVGLL